MIKIRKSNLIFLIFCLLSFFFSFSSARTGAFINNRLRVNVENQMPVEYSILKSILKRLALSNDLGEETIYFIINSGSYANWMAMEIDICDQGDCTFFRGLNPFKLYRGVNQHEINEIIRQSFLLGRIEASAAPNNNVFFSRSTFKVIDNRKDILAFIMAHEISHILQDTSFVNSLQESKRGRKLETKDRKNLAYKISRDSEISADKQACSILYNANYPLDTCTDAIKFGHKESGDGEETKDDSTHPGYEDRIKSMESYKAELLRKGQDENTFNFGVIEYDREMNFLQYSPK